jgi:hypothetical protein
VNGPDIGVAAAAALIGVSMPTVRRMFDAEQPHSGTVLEHGRTAGKERRVNAAWAEQKAQAVAARRAARAGAAADGDDRAGPATPGS